MKGSLFICLIMFFGQLVYSQGARVVGYLPSYHFSQSHNIEYCKITHLNLAFANPDPTGNIIMNDFSEVVEHARDANPDIIISLSLAGAYLTDEQVISWSNLIGKSEKRSVFIDKIVQYLLDYDLDGVDIDLEWDHVTSGYSSFVTSLKVALEPHDKLLTAALPNKTLYSEINQEALNSFDFINIMSYDAKGPWNPSKSGQHSSYNFAKWGIEFWKGDVGIESDRLTLGVPFYGYNFVNSTTVTEFTYRGMVQKDVKNAEIDQVGNGFYNGRPTIRRKVELAVAQVGGIMIWELSQDSFDEYSLLRTIHNKFRELEVTTTGLCVDYSAIYKEPLLKSTVYPIPAKDYFMINIGTDKNPQIEITDIGGHHRSADIVSCIAGELCVDISGLESGYYVIEVYVGGEHITREKLIIIK